MFGRLPDPRPQRLYDFVHLGLGIRKAKPRIDDEIRTFAFHRIGNLPGQYRLELRLRHLAAGHDALLLHIRRRCNHSYYVDPLVAARLEQQRNVENDDVGLVGFRLLEEGAVSVGDDGVDDVLELLHRLGILRDLGAQLGAVDAAIRTDHPRKGPFDGSDGFASRGVGCMHGGVSVVHGDAPRREHGGCRRLAHADGPCERQFDHARAATASRQALSADASSGVIPNQMRKAAAACPTNMGSPSWGVQPAAAAA